LVSNSNFGFNNDRPSVVQGNGAVLVGRYPYNQPDFIQLDARLQKDLRIGERYRAQLSADFFNLTNRANVYSNPDTNSTIDYSGHCTPRTPLPPGSPFVTVVPGPIGFNCTPLAALPPLIRHGANPAALGFINQIAPGSTPFAFQAGFKFIF